MGTSASSTISPSVKKVDNLQTVAQVAVSIEVKPRRTPFQFLGSPTLQCPPLESSKDRPVEGPNLRASAV